ncbi:hypothetical protein K3495_g16360, partial [Podosphaera aphanis]
LLPQLYVPAPHIPVTTGYEPGAPKVHIGARANHCVSQKIDKMKMIDANEMLGNGVPFVSWRMSLQAKLGRKNVLGHVFHDIPGIRPLRVPIDPAAANPDADIPPAVNDAFLADLEKWTLGEIEAKSIIIQRLSSTICPQHYFNMTAKQLYDTIAGTRIETATAPYASALETFMSIRFANSADDYIDCFLSALQNVNNAADTMAADTTNSGYQIGEGQASAVFVMGTKRIDWLSTWRDTRAYNADNRQ